MNCQRCNGHRIFRTTAKTSDCCDITNMHTRENYLGYVPEGFNLRLDSDTIIVFFCIDCGQMQGKWPVHPQAWTNALAESIN